MSAEVGAGCPYEAPEGTRGYPDSISAAGKTGAPLLMLTEAAGAGACADMAPAADAGAAKGLAHLLHVAAQ